MPFLLSLVLARRAASFIPNYTPLAIPYRANSFLCYENQNTLLWDHTTHTYVALLRSYAIL